MSGLALLSLTALPSMAAGIHSTGEIELNELPIQIPSLPPAFEGYRIGFVSDLHVGPAVPFEWVEHASELLSKSVVDLLLLGGDYIWIPDRPLLTVVRNRPLAKLKGETLLRRAFQTTARMLAGIPARDGKFAVLGNHDNWHAPALARFAFREAGFTVLDNQAALVRRGTERLNVVGCDDYYTGYPRWPQTLSGTKDRREGRVLLAHNPDFISYIMRKTAFEFDLGLAGHTHGGQVKAPGLGALFYNVNDTRLAEGLFRGAGAQVYTSRGVGVSKLPFRLNCPAEVNVFVLQRA